MKEEFPDDLTSQLGKFAPQIPIMFDIDSRIASGSFGTVYKASWKTSNRLVAIKHIIPTCKPSRSINEIRCLQALGGRCNVSAIISCIRYRDNIFIVMPYYEHQKFQTYYLKMTNDEIKRYMRSLFNALRHIHKFGIVHRDVKPSNFIYCQSSKQHVLIDFGLVSLSHGHENTILVSNSKYANDDINKKNDNTINHMLKVCLHPNTKVCNHCTTRPKKIAMRAGTAGYRAPEVLMKYSNQTTTVDVWSAGIIFLSIVTSCYPFFKSSSDMGHLSQITAIFGSDAIKEAARAINVRFVCVPDIPGCPLEVLCFSLRKHTCNGPSPCNMCIPSSAFALLSRCLDPNPNTRITADEALQMPYLKRD